jgi:hypothetical protein
MTPISVANEKPQPDAALYGTDALELFTSYSRDSYLAAFQVEAPAFDPSKPTKTWFDSSVDLSDPDNNLVQYNKLAPLNGSWGIKKFTLLAADAAVVNLLPRPSVNVDPSKLSKSLTPVPVRQLKPDETLLPTSDGLGVHIHRDGFMPQDNTFLLSDRVLLYKIAQKIGA